MSQIESREKANRSYYKTLAVGLVLGVCAMLVYELLAGPGNASDFPSFMALMSVMTMYEFHAGLGVKSTDPECEDLRQDLSAELNQVPGGLGVIDGDKTVMPISVFPKDPIFISSLLLSRISRRALMQIVRMEIAYLQMKPKLLKALVAFFTLAFLSSAAIDRFSLDTWWWLVPISICIALCIYLGSSDMTLRRKADSKSTQTQADSHNHRHSRFHSSQTPCVQG